MKSFQNQIKTKLKKVYIWSFWAHIKKNIYSQILKYNHNWLRFSTIWNIVGEVQAQQL